jgi:hypothetical protein
MQAGLGFPEVWLARAQPGSPLAARAISYGFGLNAIRDCGWGREVEHSGGLPGFGSNMRWLPDHGVGVIVLTNLTYASTGPLAREALLLLQETGALQPRQPMPSRQLMEMAQAATELVLDSNDKRVRAFAADNLFRNEPLEDRKASIARLRGGLRDCRRGEMRAESALRGTFRIDCTGGRLDVSLTLTPERPARIQSLDVSAAHTASDALARAAEAVTGAIASGVQGVPVVPGFDRAGLAAALEATRYAFGTCRLGELVESDGSTTAKYSLVCDRGRLDMSLSLEEGQLAAAMLVPSTRASCVP